MSESDFNNMYNNATKFSSVLELEDTPESAREPVILTLEEKKALFTKTIRLLLQEVTETLEAVEVDDNIEIIDGFGDVSFISLNGLYKIFRILGHDHENAKYRGKVALNRICDSNLAKLQPDGTVKKVNGKVVKPAGWLPPTFDDLL